MEHGLRNSEKDVTTTRVALKPTLVAQKITTNITPPPRAIALVAVVQFDLRNLLVVNPHQVDEGALADGAEEYLKGNAQAAMQSLINRCVRVCFVAFLLRR